MDNHASVSARVARVHSSSFLDAEMLVVGRLQDAVDPDNAHPLGLTTNSRRSSEWGMQQSRAEKSVALFEKWSRAKTNSSSLTTERIGLAVTVGVRLDDNGAILNYLRGALALKDKSAVSRLRYSAKFLQDPCKDVVNSVFFEFSNAAYVDLRKAAENLNPEPFAKGLRDGQTPIALRGTYAGLLGQCGNAEHAVLLRKLIEGESKETESTSVLSAMFLASILLDAKSNWKFVVGEAERDSASFVRVRAVRCVRLANTTRSSSTKTMGGRHDAGTEESSLPISPSRTCARQKPGNIATPSSSTWQVRL